MKSDNRKWPNWQTCRAGRYRVLPDGRVEEQWRSAWSAVYEYGKYHASISEFRKNEYVITGKRK